MTHAADVRIGTSGWHYHHWIGPFYPPATRPHGFLEHYARHFSTVEINNTFYRLPTRHAVLQWRDGSPSGFVFATKGSRFIRHMKKLKDPETSIRKYFDLIELLGDKLGPIVFQLPPRWHFDLDRLADFLKTLPKRWQYAFEFRDESWFDPRVYEMLAKHKAALCLYDYAGRQAPLEVTADFVYIRLHGPGGRLPSTTAPSASSGWNGAPILRTRIRSSGASSARATSNPTGTPPRGSASTTGRSSLNLSSRCASAHPASLRSANRTSRRNMALSLLGIARRDDS
jgi:uncharacterized protein YecE (DUF72 family)